MGESLESANGSCKRAYNQSTRTCIVFFVIAATGARGRVINRCYPLLYAFSPLSQESMVESIHDFSSVVGSDKAPTSNPLFADDVDGTEDTVTSAFGESTPARSNPLYDDM